MNIKRVKIKNFNIQLSLWGNNENCKTVFCVHGISSNSRVWNTIAENLEDEFNFMAIDLRGRGRSDAPGGYSLHNHVEDIKKVLDTLNVKKIVLAGHSLGAYICVMFASLYPEYVEKTILFDGGGKLPTEQAQKVFQGIKPSLERLGKIYESFEDYISHMQKAPFLQPWYEPMNNYYMYELEKLSGGRVKSRVKAETILEEIENLSKVDISKFYSQINSPVFILRATEGMMSNNDHLLPESVAKEMLLKIPRATLINIKGSNHYTIVFYPNEERDSIIREIIKE